MIKIKSKVKILRRFKLNIPSLTTKKIKIYKRKRPGEHSSFYRKKTSTKLNYFFKFIEKQKLKFNYALSEKQLKNYINLSYTYFTKTSDIIYILYDLLELRFDCIIYKLGFAKTIIEARQMINHGHFYLNNIKITKPSFRCKPEDIISTNFILAKNNLILKNKINKIPKHLNILNYNEGKILYNPSKYLKKNKITNMFTKTFEFY